MKVISFANQKGGVGKTTLCVQFCLYLRSLKKKVLLVDMDAQGNASSVLCIQDHKHSMPLYGTRCYDLFNPELKSIQTMLCPSGVELIHTPENDLDQYEIENTEMESVLIPKKHFSKLDEYDYIVIDTPPSLGRILVSALAVSTHVVCPVQLSNLGVSGVMGLLETIEKVKNSINENLTVTGVLANSVNTRSPSCKQSYAQLKEAIPEMLFESEISLRAPIENAINQGIPVWSIKSGSAREAARELKTAFSEILDRIDR